MNTCESHGDAVVVYLKSTCPLCAAKEEIEEHEKSNSELTEQLSTKEAEIDNLKEELATVHRQLNN